MSINMDSRTSNILKQIKWSLVFKVGAFFVYYITISQQVKLLGVDLYGVWSTLLSIITWILFFDFGIGNGIKNSLTKAIAENDLVKARSIIFTGYTAIGFISLFFFLLILTFTSYFNVSSVFNTNLLDELYFKKVIIVLFAFICVHFVMSFVKQFVYSVQKNALNDFEQMIFFIVLFLILIMGESELSNNILNVAIAYGISLIISKLILTAIFFKSNSNLIPKLGSFNKVIMKKLINVGGLFFLLQLVSMSILLSDRFIITQLLGPSHVTSYDIIYRLFATILIIHGIINAPLWAAYTESYHKNDFTWIKSSLKKMNFLVLFLCVLAILLYLMNKEIIAIWIGGEIENSTSVSLSLALYVIVLSWCNNFAFFLNAIGNIKIQFYTLLFGAVLNIPLSILLVRYFGYGISGVVIATILSLLPFAIIGPIQVIRILYK